MKNYAPYKDGMTKASLEIKLENDGYRVFNGVWVKRQDGLIRYIIPGTFGATVSETLEEK